MAWRTLLARIVDTINAIAALVCHALLVIITSVTVLQVFLRYVLNRPTSWSEEIALFGLIWFGLLAVAIGVRRHEHVAITFLRDMSPPLLATALDYLAQLCIIVFMFVVMFYGHDLITLAGVQVLPASGWPKWWLYVPTILGGGLGMFNGFANILLKDVRIPEHGAPELNDAR